MKKHIKILIIFVCLGLIFGACQEYLEPSNNNDLSLEQLKADPEFAEGILLEVYKNIPDHHNFQESMTSDDAVTNQKESNYLRMATGEWTSSFYPMQKWDFAYENIRNLNLFLDYSDEVVWSWESSIENKMHMARLKGEAHGLRAWFQFYLLQYHSGESGSGEILGYPIVTKVYDINDDWELPRASFLACVDSIYSDINIAINNLPSVYGDIEHTEQALLILYPGSLIELRAEVTLDDNSIAEETLVTVNRNDSIITEFEGVKKINTKLEYIVTNESNVIRFAQNEIPLLEEKYENAFGDHWLNRIDGYAAKALRSRVALYAASPAYNPDNNSALWEAAAKYSGDLITELGGLKSLGKTGTAYWTSKKDVDNIWRTTEKESSSYEKDNFPPSLYGTARINPSQNLVDAFPMENGYPALNPDGTPFNNPDPNYQYNPENPYENRDPRMGNVILLNGEVFAEDTIFAYVGAKDDGLNDQINSTRTGYYLKKFLSPKVVLRPSVSPNKKYFLTYIRLVEIALNYAEAANEMGIEESALGFDFTARDIIVELRDRAKVRDEEEYVDLVAGDQLAFRQLIRNERRIELCFEGHRFWDIRRWEDYNAMRQPVWGMEITKTNDGYSYKKIEVEKRDYPDNHMIYGPIPYEETLKYNLTQNAGW